MGSSSVRVSSIDIMRGLTLCLMLFVNDLFVPGVPSWMVHTEAATDGMGLADWVFPGFLFMVGISIPYAIDARKKRGDSSEKVLWHILFRSISLIIVGLLIYNGGRINPEISGISKLLWITLLYTSIFLFWNSYPSNSKWKKLFQSLRVLGLMGLIFLSYIFKAGSPGNVEWMETGWWGILGLIGWGYLTAALVYLIVSDKIFITIIVWLLFVLLNILTQKHLVHFSGLTGKIFAIVLEGNVPSIVLAGMITGIFIRKNASQKKQLSLWLLLSGIFCIASGFTLRHWFIISKIFATPSWAMICNGISLVLLTIIYYFADLLGKKRWAGLFAIAGKNSLTTYLAPDLVYFLCWGLNIPLFFYKQDSNVFLAVTGSIVWALAMIMFAHGLSKIGIKLKL